VFSAKGKKFKGDSKCRNKTISKEERKIKHIKKESEKQYHRTATAREHIGKFCNKQVECNAKLKTFKSNDPFAPCLLQNVHINGEYVDHIWVTFDIADRRKLKLCKLGYRIYFIAEVKEYYKRYDREVEIKCGLKSIKLVTEYTV